MSLYFALLFSISVLLFCISCYRSLGIVRLGGPEYRFGNPALRLRNMLVFGVFQKKNLEEPYGFNHTIMFWSFMVFAIADAAAILHGIFPAYKIAEPAAIALIFDIAPALTFACIAAAFIRRFLFPPENIKERSNDVLIMLAVIAILIVAYFGNNAAQIASNKAAASFMPVAGLFARIFSGIEASSVEIAGNVFLSLPAFVLLFFAAYVPYSRHMHMMAAIPNAFLSKLDAPAVMPRETFVADNVFGVGAVNRFSWKDLLDTYSCTECGRCEKACPAANTGKTLNPRHIIRDIQENLFANAPSLRKNGKITQPLIGSGGSIREKDLWSCTTCAACIDRCPVSIEHLPKIIKMRRHLAQAEAEFPEELLTLFENMEQRSNPWGVAPSEKAKWYAHIEVKPFEPGKTEYLLFVGCAGALDSRAKQMTVATAKILNSARVSWGVLGAAEKCCGDSMRRLGNEYVFEQMAIENVKLFAEKGIKKIITPCPHCFNTLKNDYRQCGAKLEVLHHSEFILGLIKNGKLKLKQNTDLGKTVFHDPCYLGRHNNMFDAPRDVIRMTTGKAPSDMERHHRKSFCCGAGGGRMWMEENEGTRINRTRIQEALKEKPDTISVSCPYCLIMFEDGLKDELAFDKVRVKDIAEIAAEGVYLSAK